MWRLNYLIQEAKWDEHSYQKQALRRIRVVYPLHGPGLQTLALALALTLTVKYCDVLDPFV